MWLAIKDFCQSGLQLWFKWLSALKIQQINVYKIHIHYNSIFSPAISYLVFQVHTQWLFFSYSAPPSMSHCTQNLTSSPPSPWTWTTCCKAQTQARLGFLWCWKEKFYFTSYTTTFQQVRQTGDTRFGLKSQYFVNYKAKLKNLVIPFEKRN